MGTFGFTHLFNHNGLALFQHKAGTTLEESGSKKTWTRKCFGVLTSEIPSDILFPCDFFLSLLPYFLPSFFSFFPFCLPRILRKRKENLREKGDDFLWALWICLIWLNLDIIPIKGWPFKHQVIKGVFSDYRKWRLPIHKISCCLKQICTKVKQILKK